MSSFVDGRGGKTFWTGRSRQILLFFTQYEFEGPAYHSRWQNPENADQWPRSKWWSYKAPTSEVLKNGIGC